MNANILTKKGNELHSNKICKKYKSIKTQKTNVHTLNE